MECGKAAAEIPAAAETAAGSAPDFMIHGVMKYTIGGQELWVTTTTVGLLVITVMLILLAFMAKRTMERASDVPGTFQNILETGVERGIMKMMGAGCSSPVGINAEADGDTVRVRAVSYGYSDVPRRVERELSVDYVMDELLDIAEYLTARRDSI